MFRPLVSLATVAIIACATSQDDGDTDAIADTDASHDTDVATETGDTGGDTDETDVIDTDGEHVVMHGQLLCELPNDTDADTDDDGVPATPGFVKITLTTPWACQVLSGCTENRRVEVIASTNVDGDGVFDLDFQTGPYTVDELFVYTNHKIGVCGNGYQFTQAKLTDYDDWSDIVIDVDSIFY